MMLKKILVAIITPSKWRILYELIYSFLANIIKYGNFSINPNTKKHWDRILSGFNDFWRNENYSHILDVFPRDSEFSLFDIGCAMGDGCELLHENFPKATITGADISEVGIEKAKQKTKGVEYIVLDILKQPIPKKYDWITLVETLEHFDNPLVIVDKCLKHVRQAIIISAPYNQKLFASNKLQNISEHRYSFNESTFASYNCRVLKITEYIEATKARCIIYEIRPK